MKRFVRRHSSFLTWAFLPSLLLVVSVLGIHLVSRPVVSNPGENCSLDAECTDSTGCFLEFCNTQQSECERSGVNPSAPSQACFQCLTCGNGTCEQADSNGDPLENIQTCPQDCTIQGDIDVCEFFNNACSGSERDRCCARSCQGTDPQDSTFDADCCNGCGDNLISGTETCDGTAVRTGLTPPSGGNACRGAGTAGECTYCGDGNVDSTGGEQCDPPNGTTCGATCQVLNCGDGIVTPPEQCEPPNTATCNATCQSIVAQCGNGIVEAGEECDGATCSVTVNGDVIPGVCQACQCFPECQTEGSGCGDDGTNGSGVCFAGTGGSSLIPVGARAGVLAQWLAAFAVPGAAFAALKLRRRFKK